MTEELKDLGFEESEEFDEKWIDEDLKFPTPSDIFDMLSEDIIGQESAKKSVSMIAWNLLCGRRSVNLFIGETGSGKTALFRSLEEHLNIRVVTIDASKLTASGWKGPSVGDVIAEANITGTEPVILFFDEADTFFKPKYGSDATTNHAELIQKDLLMLCDTDNSYATVYKENTKHATRIWLHDVAIILAGAFQDLFDERNKPKSTLGFIESSNPKESSRIIEIDDLIKYGMIREFAGRVQRIVCLESVDEETMFQIAQRTVQLLEDEYECSITVDENLLKQIAIRAKDSRLGARYIRKELIEYIDTLQFMTPETREYQISD